jgi:hypothetical protein
MKLEELLEKIKAKNVPERWYAINDGVKPGACVILDSNGQWEGFCIDEKGERSHFNFFLNPEGAYDWLWEKMKLQLEVFG